MTSDDIKYYAIYAFSPRLGRHVRHDPRSREYPFQAPTGQKLRTVIHDRYVRHFDQGAVGACTGMAALGALATHPLYDSTVELTADGNIRGWEGFSEETARDWIYSAATCVDDFQGVYPPDDTGSDGLSVAKVLHKAGLIGGYRWCFTFQDFLGAVQAGPVTVGTNWYDSMNEPDENGVISIDQGAVLEGGHQWLVRGYDASTGHFLADNSWAESWGLGGSFLVPQEVMQRLLDEDGDATFFEPPLMATEQVPDFEADGAEIREAFEQLASGLNEFARRFRTAFAAFAEAMKRPD